MMRKPDGQSVIGVLAGVINGVSATTPASRNMPRSGFNISVKRINDPYRTRTMAVPVATATSQPRYLAAQGAV